MYNIIVQKVPRRTENLYRYTHFRCEKCITIRHDVLTWSRTHPVEITPGGWSVYNTIRGWYYIHENIAILLLSCSRYDVQMPPGGCYLLQQRWYHISRLPIRQCHYNNRRTMPAGILKYYTIIEYALCCYGVWV